MRLLLAAFLVVVSTAEALAERRVALVLGVDEYQTLRPLENAVNDAGAVEGALEALGFEVIAEADRNLKRMRRALEDFEEDAAGADVALVFFAGHGVEIGGENRLLPTDADASSLDQLKATSLPLEEVREVVASVAKVGLVVLDACRNDPFGSEGASGRGAKALAPDLAAQVRPGLGRVGRAENTLFAFSAAPGETASDGSDGHSPFSAALAKYLATDGLEIRSVLTLVQQEVYDRSRGQQLPYVESGLPQLFFASTTRENLPERERLLLAMADVTPAIRSEIEQIAAIHEMPLAPLYGALISSDAANLAQEERAQKLTEAATAFVSVREEMKRLASDDPQVTKLRQQGEEQLALGAFVAARAKLAEAATIDATSRQALKTNYVERTISEAATYYLSGAAARTELRYELAIADYEKVVELYAEVEEALSPQDRRQQWLTSLELADVHLTVGSVTEAAFAYEVGHEVITRLAANEPVNAELQYDLAASHSRIGDVRMDQGNLTGALAAYEAGLAIAQRLAATSPANSKWLRGLSVSHTDVGDVRVAQGDLTGALAAYQAGLAIRQRLAASDPIRSDWQHDLVVSHSRIGDVHQAQDDLAGALAAYEAGLAIAQRLAATDPSNAQWQKALLVSLNKVGNVRLAHGDSAGALAIYEAGLAIAERLASIDPRNADFQRQLSISHSMIGHVHWARGDLAGALAAYEADHAITQSLAAADPANVQWQRDLSISQERIGSVRLRQGDLSGALVAYEASLAISQRLAASDTSNAEWQRDLIVSHYRMARVSPQRRQHLERALAIAEGLQREGRLAPSDSSMPEELRQELARLH